MPGEFIIIKERDHLHADTSEEPCLVDGYIDGMGAGFEQEIALFRGLDPYREENRPSAGCADTKIAVPFIDIVYHFRSNRDFPGTRALPRIGEHDASIIGSTN